MSEESCDDFVKGAPTGNAHFERLATDLEARLAAGFEQPWIEGDFGRLALAAFAYQYEHNPTYRRFCDGRHATPGTVASWRTVPAVPTTAFKHLDLISAEGDGADLVFLTSGTTRGGASHGRHLVPRPSLYRAALLSNFRRHVVPDVDAPPLLSLVPSPDQAPDSSLSYMVGAVADEIASDAEWLVSGDGAIDLARLQEVWRDVISAGDPVLLIGTAFAFMHVMDAVSPGSLEPLPDRSRIMETGGFKGRAREISRGDFYERLSSATGVPTRRIVNEYGMTELLSQLYEETISAGADPGSGHVPPPWLAVHVLDPTTLEPVDDGHQGLLAFFDLANLGSICHVLTEDVGMVRDGKLHLSGRHPGAEPRGCSRAMDELMVDRVGQ